VWDNGFCGLFDDLKLVEAVAVIGLLASVGHPCSVAGGAANGGLDSMDRVETIGLLREPGWWKASGSRLLT
jgi:hypothetical protein